MVSIQDALSANMQDGGQPQQAQPQGGNVQMLAKQVLEGLMQLAQSDPNLTEPIRAIGKQLIQVLQGQGGGTESNAVAESGTQMGQSATAQ